jgi:hypothetical protein
MARHPYPDAKRKKLTEEALRQLRATRKLIAPDLLAKGRQVIAEHAARQKALQDNQATEERITVDRARNMTVIRKFMELRSDDKDLKRQIADLFPEA